MTFFVLFRNTIYIIIFYYPLLLNNLIINLSLSKKGSIKVLDLYYLNHKGPNAYWL